MAAIEEVGMKPTEIWLTHGHIDHAAGAMDMKEAYGIDIIGPHEDDLPLLEGLEKQAQMFGLEGQVRDCQPDRWLREGEIMTIGEHEFDVLKRTIHGKLVEKLDLSRLGELEGDTLRREIRLSSSTFATPRTPC